MNICYICNMYPPEILGGAEIIVEKTAVEVAKKGHDVTVITTDSSDNIECVKRDNVTIYRLNTTRLYPPYKQTEISGIKKPLWHLFDLWNNKTLQKIKEILIKEDIDVIHVNNYKGLSLSCFKAGKDLDIPVLFESHDFSLICPRANLIRGNNTLCTHRNVVCNMYVQIQKKLLNDNIDTLVSPSNFMINLFRENGFFNQTKCVKIPLGVDYESKRTIKDYDTIDITYIGSLGKHKGVQTLIKAFMEIKNSDVRLHLIGKGYDVEEFKELSKYDDRIVFHGFVDNDKINKFYELSNVIIIPSICYDNSPMVIYESFSTATPVIGSNIGGIPELINDGENGLLFESGNVEELKKQLLKIIDDTNLLRRLEDNAFKSLPSNSIDMMINSLINEYETLIYKNN